MTDTDLQPVEDHRVHPGICGVTYVGGTGLEWICIKDPHDTEYRRHGSPGGYVSGTGAHPERLGGTWAPAAERHYFVRRWPNRDS